MLENRLPNDTTDALRDRPTVAPDGTELGDLPDGVRVRDLITHTDDRGTLFELYNIGDREAVIVNFPTRPYEHEDPDKFRLPLDTDAIPYTWPEGTQGW